MCFDWWGIIMRSIGRKKKAKKIVALAAVIIMATTAAIISTQSQNLYPLFYQTLLPYMNTPTNQPILIKADETWSDTIVSNTTIKENMEIILNGNLTIADGGILTLTNVTLRVNCTLNGEHRI